MVPPGHEMPARKDSAPLVRPAEQIEILWFSIRQTTFGIKLVSVAGGTLKLKDDLKYSFDIVAPKNGRIMNGVSQCA